MSNRFRIAIRIVAIILGISSMLVGAFALDAHNWLLFSICLPFIFLYLPVHLFINDVSYLRRGEEPPKYVAKPPEPNEPPPDWL